MGLMSRLATFPPGTDPFAENVFGILRKKRPERERQKYSHTKPPSRRGVPTIGTSPRRGYGGQASAALCVRSYLAHGDVEEATGDDDDIGDDFTFEPVLDLFVGGAENIIS